MLIPLKSVAPAFTGQSRSYAKATLIGGLIAVPEERQTTAGKNYFMYVAPTCKVST
jgi:hypothetical protein